MGGLKILEAGRTSVNVEEGRALLSTEVGGTLSEDGDLAAPEASRRRSFARLSP